MSSNNNEGSMKAMIDEKVSNLENENLINAMVPTNKDGTAVEFLPSETFVGSKPGYTFKKGDSGVGYYFDKNGFLMEKMKGMQQYLDAKDGIKHDSEKVDESLAPIPETLPEGTTVEVKFTEPKWGMTARMTGGPVVVTKIKEGGQAAAVGLCVGDVLKDINGISIVDVRSAALAELRKGGEATATFIRPNIDILSAVTAIAPPPVVEQQTFSAVGGTKDITPEEMKELKAMLGNSKAKDTAVVKGQTGVTETIPDGNFSNSATLVFAECKDCAYTLENYCMKVYVHNCHNFVLRAKTKILTSTVETYKGSNVSLIFSSSVGTLQADQVDGLSVEYANKDLFTMLIWAGCENVNVKFTEGNQSIASGFSECQKEFHGTELSRDRSQFKISMVDGKLTQERVIRLDNGFTTTMREKIAFDAKQEQNLAAMAEKMGITIKPGNKGIKCKPNEPCPCSSGKKFKKCCSHGSDYYMGDGIKHE